MFKNVSMTGTGLVITLIQTLLTLFGFEFETDSLAAGINGLVAFFGFIFLIWGQLRRKDLSFGLIRK